MAARPLRTLISPHNIHSPVCERVCVYERERESATEIESAGVFDRKWQRVCMCELGQADNSMASEGAADKPLLLLGVTRPC